MGYFYSQHIGVSRGYCKKIIFHLLCNMKAKTENQNEPDYKTMAGAWKIASDFADAEAKNANSLFPFNDTLPYKKDKIVLALLNLFTSDDFRALMHKKDGGEKVLEELAGLLLRIATIYIPSESEYKEIIGLKKIGKKIATCDSSEDLLREKF